MKDKNLLIVSHRQIIQKIHFAKNGVVLQLQIQISGHAEKLRLSCPQVYLILVKSLKFTTRRHKRRGKLHAKNMLQVQVVNYAGYKMPKRNCCLNINFEMYT